MDVLSRIVKIQTAEEKTERNVISAIPHYKEREDEQKKLSRHREVNLEDDDLLQNNWTQKINFNVEYGKHKENFMKMVSNFANMWGGRLGTVRPVKHRIKFEPADSRPIRSAPYR